MNDNLIQLLLSSNALQIAPAHQPFWYTSGTIGPYYLNAHYLFGGREKAEDLLAFIESVKDNPQTLLPELLGRVTQAYDSESGFRSVIRQAVTLAEQQIGDENIDFVSGGERRDWFFSLAVATHLNKTSLAIFKNKEVYALFDENDVYRARKIATLEGKRILHVADLVTEASSYTRTWIPAIEGRGGRMNWTINVVDRGQGGREVLENHGISVYNLIEIGSDFFTTLCQEGFIGNAEAEVLTAYHRDPRESMQRLLVENPEIVHAALKSEDPKIRQRARLMLQNNPYELSQDLMNQWIAG